MTAAKSTNKGNSTTATGTIPGAGRRSWRWRPSGERLVRPERWDRDSVRQWLVQAAETLKRLPDHERRHLSRLRTCWPQVARDSLPDKGDGDPRGRYRRQRPALAAASPEAIDNLDIVMGWFGWLPPARQRLVWARACGISAAALCRRVGCHRITITRGENRALDGIVARLNGEAEL